MATAIPLGELPHYYCVSVDDRRYQTGICKRCDPNAHQLLLFAMEDCSDPLLESGKIAAYAQIRTLALFRCEGCKTTLFYETMLEDEDCGYSIEAVDLSKPEAVLESDTGEFWRRSDLIYLTTRYSQCKDPVQRAAMREAALRQSLLPPIVPKKIRDIYEEALSVKHVPNSFAVQVGRALEAVQKDLGIPKS